MYHNASIDDSATLRFPAAAEMTDAAMLAVAINSDGKAVLPAQGAMCVGITVNDLDDKVPAGAPVTAIVKEKCYWIAGAAVAPGTLLMADATGKAVTATSGKHVLAMALETGRVGKPMRVMLMHTVMPA